MGALPTGLPPAPALPAPVFVTDSDGLNPNLILADMISEFEAAAGRTLQPAQVERLLINLYAYRESLVRNAIQYAAQQNLLAFASFPMIDYLGSLLNVTRLPAQAATTTILFTLVAAQTVSVTIPAGTLVGTTDGQVQFATNIALIIPAGSTAGSVTATATAAGAAANGYLAGQANVQLSPNALVQSAANTTTSTGGSSPETDDHFRGRIQAAPNQFSVAGPTGAYKYYAMSVDPSIIDVQVVSPVPGTVNVYLLTGPAPEPQINPNNAGIAGSTLIDEAQALLSSDTVRPLTDTVNVLAVTEVDYAIAGTVTTYSDANPETVLAAAQQAAQELAANLAARIQRNVVRGQIIVALFVPGAYEIVLTAPAADVILTAGQWANCTSIVLNVAVGTEHS